MTEAPTKSEGGDSPELSQDTGDLVLALAPMGSVTLGKSLPISELLFTFPHLYNEGTEPSFCLFV